METEASKKAALDDEFARGFIVACAMIHHNSGGDPACGRILREGGYTLADVERLDLTEFDADHVRRALAEET